MCPGNVAIKCQDIVNITPNVPILTKINRSLPDTKPEAGDHVFISNIDIIFNINVIQRNCYCNKMLMGGLDKSENPVSDIVSRMCIDLFVVNNIVPGEMMP